jgi:acetyl esterase/lipase
MKFKRLKNSWFMANKHYLIPLFLILAAANSVAALVFSLIALVVWGVNKLKARLPIDSGTGGESETIIYKKVGTAELKLDLWRPVRGGGGIATVVLAHGGGWVSGARNQPNLISWCRFLSDRGFSVASIDYRFAYVNKLEDILEDFSDGVNFIRSGAETLGLSRNIILMGLSAGGHLALYHAAFNTFKHNLGAMTGIKGVVAYYAPSDLNDLFSPEDKSFFARFGAGTALKALPRFDKDVYERYSPINFFSSRMVPVLAVHGRQDEVVPFFSSVNMVKRLKELGVNNRFLVHKTGGHGFEVKLKDYRTTLILEETVRFIRKVAE